MGRPKNKPLLESLIDRLTKTKTNRYDTSLNYFWNGIEYEYDTYYACRHGDACCDNDYCRCGKIQDAKITEVNLNALISGIIGYSKEIIDSYCVDRLVRTSKMKDPGYWDVNVSGGYYGQEISGVNLDQKVLDQFVSDLKSLLNKSGSDKIKFCLKAEYGYLLPELNNYKNIEIVGTSILNVDFFNQNHMRKLNREFISQYDNYSLPRAICVKTGSKFKLIDGHHRMMSAHNNNLKKVSILLFS